MFKHAIVRRPAASLVRGITSRPELGKPDYSRALRQHDAYIAALESCGLSVEVLDADERFPDSCFVEDVAVCTGRFAMITRPGADSRRDETVSILPVLARHFNELVSVSEPGTLEGGDVMMVGDRFFVGLSDRTNAEGAGQLISALERHGYEGMTVPLSSVLHLKTGLAYLEDGILLVAGEFVQDPLFREFTRIEVRPEEDYAANCIRVNERVLVPAGFPATSGRIRDAGLNVLEVDTGEFRKLDGGLSCLSLRF
ncbi:MAG TPA: arginine deiminase family protein [Rectinemataceae bacterium]|nr:arginine deiminase family protein [Rectinemataceae bacterium]